MIKNISVIVLIGALTVLTACNGGGGGGGSKSLFSQWTSTNGNFYFDITGQQFGFPFYMGFLFGTGEYCRCTVEVQGSESSGFVLIDDCTYVSGGNGDPGCVQFENGGTPYTYTKTGSTLSLCDSPGSCESYR